MTAAIINLSHEALERWKKEHAELVEQLTIAPGKPPAEGGSV
ncbi:hypothetical protein ACFO3A_01160 [Comamonas nitrativorans]|uniref:Uncharacterized protein n=1 Tax=Comamonas nitrativorans TaxID=108437 RepID=A0ABV9GS75_9BURK